LPKAGFVLGRDIQSGTGGVSMSLEAIEIICQAEEAAKNLKAEAAAKAKRALISAEEEGKAALEQLADKIAADLKVKSEAAQEKTKAELESILAKAEADKAELRKNAEDKLDKAVEYIIERIVNG
jgi:vacuolar-type H+-ATPase subunit H